MFPFIRIFSFDLPTYAVISVIGVLVAGGGALALLKKRGIRREDFLSTAIAAAAGLFIGAHLLYALTRIEEIADAFRCYDEFSSFGDFLRYIGELSSGMVFYGGLYGGMLAGVLWSKHKKYPVDSMSDLFAVFIPLFHIFGRIGCFFAGCCYGVECEWGISGRVIVADVKENARRFPVQLLEAFLLLLLFFLMLWLFNKSTGKGKLIFIYLMIYGVMRFFLEYLRGDEIRGKFLMFTTSQWISLVTILWVSLYLIIGKFKNKKSKV